MAVQFAQLHAISTFILLFIMDLTESLLGIINNRFYLDSNRIRQPITSQNGWRLTIPALSRYIIVLR